MSDTIYPDNYLLFNEESSKNLLIVVQIEGVPYYLSSNKIYSKLHYGDPGFIYGDPGFVYGGLKARTDIKELLSLDGSSLTISQKIEPEQGRGAITLLTLTFTDKDGIISQLISPGSVVDEPLGNKFIKLWVGYQQTSFPEDYLILLRGYISSTTYMPSKVMIQMADPNIKRQGQICFTPTTKLTAPISSGDLTIPVVRTDGFYDQILGPDGTYDSGIKTYLQISDEIMEYGPGALSPTSVIVSSRGARGTTAVSHSTNDDVTNSIQIGPDNFVNIALKLGLSGWNGNFDSGIQARSIVNTLDPDLGNISNSILLPTTLDAVFDEGLQPGDWVTISGSVAGNNGSFQILEILDAGSRPNRLLVVDGPLFYESPAVAVFLSFRSQFDVYPIIAGAKMKPVEIDVSTHVRLRNQFFSQSENRLRFFIIEPFGLKTFAESELFLPFGCYSITRYGQVSMAFTHPPLADEKFITLNKDNIKDITNLSVVRGLNNRRYFNEVQYSYDANDAGDFTNIASFIDTESLSKVTISRPLPIKSKGLHTDLGASVVIPRRAKFINRRYSKAAFELKFKTNWQTISQLEVGDVPVVEDNGNLKIINFSNGTRNLDSQLFEVIQRDLDLKTGDGTVTLLSSLGVEVTDRFATISPSSLTDTGSTTTSIKIKESFGAIFPSQEQRKWTPFVGLPIVVHSADYSVTSGNVTFTGLDPGDNHRLLVSPALGFTPPADYIVDIADYDTGTDPLVDRLYKISFCHLDPSITVVSGVDAFNFFVSIPDSLVFNVGQVILIHNTSYSILSPEATVTFVDTGTGQVTVGTTLGFTPAAGQLVELIGFKDGGGPYRLI